MKKMKKQPAIILFCLLTILFTSCDLFGGNSNMNNPSPNKLAKAAPKDQIYITPQIGIADITTLDPALASDAPSINAVQMVFTGLVQFDDHLQVRLQLAKSWQASSDGLTWTFYLKPNLKFSDGTPLTSKDVAYSIDRALQPATKSTVAPLYLNLIKDSEKLLTNSVSTLIGDSLLTPNDMTLTITIKKRAPYFLDMLAYPCSYVVEKSLIAKYGAAFTDHLNIGGGAGPWKIAAFIHRKEIDFVANPNYYGSKPQLVKVIMPFYQQPSAAYAAYQAGYVDTASVPTATLSYYKQLPDFHAVPQLWIDYYTMNYLAKPFDNIHIRQAFALAINKTAIVEQVWKGTALPTNHIVPQGMNGYNPRLTGPDGTQNLSGNPSKATALLAQGLHEENLTHLPPITLTYATGVGNFDGEVAALISMWHRVLGVTITPDPVPFDTLLAKIAATTGNANGLQFWGFTWVAEFPDPQDWLTHQFDKGVPNNNMNYGQNVSPDATQQQMIQQALEQADATSQPQARLQAYQQAEQQLVNDVAWMPMEQVLQVFLRQPYVIGIVDNALGTIPPDDWASIYIAQH